MDGNKSFSSPTERETSERALSWRERVSHWRRSLLGRLLFYTAVLVATMTWVLFIGMDELATRHFDELHRKQRAQWVASVQQALRDESQRLLSLARLAASDADLTHATYYHLHLQGERRHPQGAIERLQRALGLHTITLQSPEGELVAQVRGGPSVPGLVDHGAPEVQVLWLHGQAWLRVRVPIQRLQVDLADVIVWRPLDQVFDALRHGDQTQIAIVHKPPSMGEMDVSLADWHAPDSAVRITVVNTAAGALRAAKLFLAMVLLTAGALLVALLTWVTRRELRPVGYLVNAAQAIGRGELGQKVPQQSRTEVGDLVRAFNAMSHQLVQARALAQHTQHQRQLSAIGRMAARVAHDMNNPLTVISNTVRLMRKRVQNQPEGDSALLEDLDLVHHHAQRCAGIVAGLLDYARPVRLSLEEVQLATWLAGVVRRWAVAHPDEPPTRMRCLSPEVRVRANLLQLERCVENLLSNARQACPVGVVQVCMAAELDRIMIRVLDEGRGFDPTAVQHLFEPFYTTKPQGNGLGLANCMAIMHAHGGGIEVPDPSRGEVLIWLPALGAAQA
ncbi:MAG: hypothetical protein Fur007_08010 [Rhodoferax sp.]